MLGGGWLTSHDNHRSEPSYDVQTGILDGVFPCLVNVTSVRSSTLPHKLFPRFSPVFARSFPPQKRVVGRSFFGFGFVGGRSTLWFRGFWGSKYSSSFRTGKFIICGDHLLAPQYHMVLVFNVFVAFFGGPSFLLRLKMLLFFSSKCLIPTNHKSTKYPRAFKVCSNWEKDICCFSKWKGWRFTFE